MTSPKGKMARKASYDNENQELVVNAAQQRNWRGIAIALLVILLVCALIVTAVIIATPKENSQSLGDKFTFEDYIGEKFYPARFHSQWLSGSDEFLYKTVDHELRIFNCSTNSSRPVMDNSTFKDQDPKAYVLSPDGLYILLKQRVKQVFRHTTLAEYSVYNIHSNDPEPIPGIVPGDNTYQYVAWTPVGHALVLVYNNNLYYMEDITSSPVQLTFNGIPGLIYNGVPDWIYEEEVLLSDHALWVSPQGKYMLYAFFNDSNVPTFYYPFYGDLDNPYTSQLKIAYPKANFSNPMFSLNIVRLSDMALVTLSPPSDLATQDHLFTTVVWRNNEQVLVTWMNRVQNRAIITLCEASNGSCTESLDLRSETGWLQMLVPPTVSPDGSRYFLLLPQKEGDAGTYKHVAMIEIQDRPKSDRKTFLTHGTWEVSSIVGYNEMDQTVFFMSPFKDPRRMHLYSVSVPTKDMTCLSCDYHKQCQYNGVSMSPSTEFYIFKCLGPGIPKYSLLSIAGQEIERLENNTDFAERIRKKAMPWIDYEQVQLDNGEKIWAKLYFPPVLKTEEILTYPLLIKVYGGPASQAVTEMYEINWGTSLASSENIIIAQVDARGTAGRGDKFLHSIYRHLGTHEVDDTLTASRHFAKLHYVDEEKIAIWGWSYGGFLTASALGREGHNLHCGIAVAPVTDWTYYDSVYTERYMGLPTIEDNIAGYKFANISRYAENFKQASFMLVHGTADDNVHFQQSAQLVKALTEANVYFRFQMYPDEHHGLLGGNVPRHLYESMQDFLLECFQGYSEKFGQPVTVEEDSK